MPAISVSIFINPPRKSREKIYRAGNAVAEWVGLSSWIDIPLMQYSERVAEFHRMIQSAQ